MLKLVLATKNQGKIDEIRTILRGSGLKSGVEIHSLLCYPDIPDIVEDGSTFEENARKKAVAISNYTGLVAIADDSGLEVDALGGAPGIYSARFAGQGAEDSDNIDKLLELIRDVPAEERKAMFICVIAIAAPDGKVNTVRGECEGLIAEERRGASGFGYDPVFLVPEFGETFAELGAEIKNRISHRAIALNRLSGLLRDMVHQN